MSREADVNVVGGTLLPCSTEPADVGSHTVCSIVTAEFLEFSQQAGNDLSTPRPEWGFAGLAPGDRWCVCADRWLEAYDAGFAPDVVLGATHVRALDVVPIEALTEHASQLVE